jgi:hypothetical protein
MIVEINGKKPRIARDAFVAPTAVLIGDVVIESGASIWWGAVLRADWNSIHVGPRSSVQDNCVVHCTAANAADIGADVTVGHAAVIHAATVRDGGGLGWRGGDAANFGRARDAGRRYAGETHKAAVGLGEGAFQRRQAGLRGACQDLPRRRHRPLPGLIARAFGPRARACGGPRCVAAGRRSD